MSARSLFRGTIRENIGLGRLGASEAEIVAAAKAAHAHDFILGFPAGSTRRSANTACSFPAVSASVSPWLAR